ncbi:MAG: hypothetical protein ACKV2O_04680 [Acidimicrobiales bacterium]
MAAALAVVFSVSGGCAKAEDSVSAPRERVTTRATRGPAATTPSSASTSVTALSPTQTMAAPVTSGGGGSTDSAGRPLAPSATVASGAQPGSPTTSRVVATIPPVPATSAAAPPPPAPRPAGEISLSSVACGGHDDGDWVVFQLDGVAVNTNAAYGTSPVAVAGDKTVVVTLSPVLDRVSSAPAFGGCTQVVDIQRASSGSDSAVWVIGVRGDARITTVEPGPAGNGFAYVVKLRA